MSESKPKKLEESSFINDVTKDIETGQIESKIKDLIKEFPVIVFSKTTCPFCFELKRTLASYGVSFAVYEVNKAPHTSAIQNELQKISKVRTVPQLFVNQEYIGGCTDVKALQHSGKLAVILAPYIGKEIPAEKKLRFYSFLWFPEAVNSRAVRLTSLFSCVYCVLCVAFYRHDVTRWAVLALAIDYALRFIYGGAHSVIGSISAALVTRLSPVWTAGPPKQFAAFCGLFFSTFAAGLLLGHQRVGGTIVLGILMGATAIEGFLDFCFGCWVFGIAISLGIVSKEVYRPYLTLLQDRKYGYDYINAPNNFPKAVNEHYLLPGQEEPTPVDLIRKQRQEFEYKLRDFDPIRHTRVEFFGCPMAIAALAYAFKFANDKKPEGSAFRYKAGIAGQVLGIMSVVLAGIFFILHFLRSVIYPKKLIKEWQHPIYGNFFSAESIILILWGILFLPVNLTGGVSLIWIGAIFQMIIALFRVADLVYSRIAEDLVNPSLMMPPVGNFIAAVAFATYGAVYDGPDLAHHINYVELARLWFGVACLYAIVLFTITFRKSIHDHHSDNRIRPTIFIWLATASISGPAYYAVSGFDPSVGHDVLYQSLWCISLFFFALTSVGFLYNFYGYEKDMSIWIMPFSYSVFAINTVQYAIIVNDHNGLFNGLGIIALVVAATSAAVCGGYSFWWLFDGSLFKPRPKWGPISFMKLTHEAFRFYIPKLAALLAALDASNVYAVKAFVKEFEAFVAAFDEHSRHEDDILFPMARRYFPGLNLSMDEEHHKLHRGLDQMKEALVSFKKVDEVVPEVAGIFLEAIKRLHPEFNELVLPHLVNEENTVTCVARKYFSIETQIEVNRKVFDITPIEQWRIVMPFVINNLPLPMWKVRYVKTFLWAYPWRAEEIGLILYHGLDSPTYLFLAKELPEINPRGTISHKRIY